MTETQQNKVTKTLVDGVVNNPLGSIEQQKALAELAKMTELDMNQAKNLMDKEVKEMHESNELWLKKRELEIREKELELKSRELHDKLLAEQNRHTEESLKQADTFNSEKIRNETQRKVSLWDAIGKIASAVAGAIGTILAAVIGWKMYSSNTDKLLRFEETGTITSQTGKKIVGDMKTPKN